VTRDSELNELLDALGLDYQVPHKQARWELERIGIRATSAEIAEALRVRRARLDIPIRLTVPKRPE